MPVDHLIELLHEFRLDEVIWEAREYLYELGDYFPIVPKLS